MVTPATAPPVDGDRTPENSWGGATPAGSPISHVEEVLLREPPIYDPGTGARVRSMGEFLRSGFASEPTWDDELCAEFAQEEMLEMLRTVLPQEMALVSIQDVIISPARFGLMRAVMKVRVVQQKQATFARVSSVLEDIPDGGCSSESPPRPGLAPDPAQGIPGVGGRAGDQRTLCASSFIFPAFISQTQITPAGSTICFVLASLNYPEAIRLIFGRDAGEMEEITWEYLNTAGSSERADGGLSMMLRMTRLDDLGLGQLLFP